MNLDKNLPPHFFLYFSTKRPALSPEFIKRFVYRLATKIASDSKYEHVAVVLQAPEEFNGVVYKDNLKEVKVTAGNYYVFEATVYAGVIMTELDAKLINPAHLEPWTGTIEIQKSISEGSVVLAWKDAVRMLRRPYSKNEAVMSAIDHFPGVRKFRNWVYTEDSKTIFCSMFAIINWWRYRGTKYKVDDARDFTPEEIRQYMLSHNFCKPLEPFVTYKHGKITAFNRKFVNDR